MTYLFEKVLLENMTVKDAIEDMDDSMFMETRMNDIGTFCIIGGNADLLLAEYYE